MSLAPLRRRSIRRLLFAYAIDQLGDWAGELALAVLVFAATDSVAVVALVWVAHRALLALAAPLLVSRLESRAGVRVMPWVYIVQAALSCALAVSSSIGLWAILPLVALDGLLAPAARALARAALVAEARPHDLSRETNALVNLVFTANGVLALMLGALLIATVGPQAALAANAASFVVAGFAVGGTALQGATRDGGSRSGQLLRDALRYVRSRGLLACLLAGDATVMLFIFAISPVEVAFITGTLGQSTTAFGAVLTAWGAGMVVGGIAAAHLSGLTPRVLLAAATLALALSCLGVAASTSIAMVLGWSIVGGLGNGACGMTLLTVVQERTADAYQVRVGALYETMASVAPGSGFVLGGIVAATVSPRAVYALVGTGALAALLWAAAALRNTDRTHPSKSVNGVGPARGVQPTTPPMTVARAAAAAPPAGASRGRVLGVVLGVMLAISAVTGTTASAATMPPLRDVGRAVDVVVDGRRVVARTPVGATVIDERTLARRIIRTPSASGCRLLDAHRGEVLWECHSADGAQTRMIVERLSNGEHHPVPLPPIDGRPVTAIHGATLGRRWIEASVFIPANPAYTMALHVGRDGSGVPAVPGCIDGVLGATALRCLKSQSFRVVDLDAASLWVAPPRCDAVRARLIPQQIDSVEIQPSLELPHVSPPLAVRVLGDTLADAGDNSRLRIYRCDRRAPLLNANCGNGLRFCESPLLRGSAVIWFEYPEGGTPLDIHVGAYRVGWRRALYWRVQRAHDIDISAHRVWIVARGRLLTA